MAKRLYLLLGSYLAFYYLLHLVYDMPNLVHGRAQFEWLPDSLAGWAARLGDLGFYFLFALAPYLALCRWYPQKKILQTLLLIIVSLPLVFLFRYWTERGVSAIPRGIRLRSFFQNNIFYSLISLVFGTVFYFIRYSYYRELQQKEQEIQSRQSELSFLRSQINPHFLFNSLNNIYSLVYQGSGQALTAIAGLSDLLRYMLYDATEKVPLEKEMDYIQKYIGLQRLRFEHPIQATVQIKGDLQGVEIAPLLLIPFVENAFKHGDLSAAGGGLAILLDRQKNKILFHCTNRKGHHQKDPGGGIGLGNVKRRLSLLYPDRHVLTIDDGPINFSINLELTHD